MGSPSDVHPLRANVTPYPLHPTPYPCRVPMPVTVQKLGVRLSPPCLLLVYRPEGGGLRLRKMPVKSLTALSSCARVAQELRERHRPHLDTVPQNKLLKMLRILQVSSGRGGATQLQAGRKINFKRPMVVLNYLHTAHFSSISKFLSII